MKLHGALAAFCLLFGVLLGTVAQAQAQQRVCGDFDGDHPIAWLVCSWEDTNDRVDTVQRRIDQLEARLTSMEARVGEVAWAKANDRIGLFQQQSTTYKDKWFYDEIYKRFRVHVCRAGVPHNTTISCDGVR